MPIASAEYEQSQRLYEWLKGLAAQGQLPWGQFGRIERELQCTKTALVVDYRQMFPDENFSSEMDEELDAHGIGTEDDTEGVYAVVTRCHPDYAMELYRTVAEAVAHCSSMGLKVEVHVYDLPDVYH